MLRAILVYACAACGLAQEVTLLPRFKAGDRFRLELTRTREDSRRPQANGTGRTPVDVRVVDAGGAGFLLEWTPGQSSTDNPEALRNPIVKQALDSAAGLRFEILLDRQGGFDGIRNQAEVNKKLESMFDGLLAGVLKLVPDAKMRATVESGLRQTLSPEMLLQSATSDIQLYFALHGFKLTRGSELVTQVEQPFPLGGGTVPASFRIALDRVEGERLFISTQTTYDKAALAAAMRRAIAQVPGPKPLDGTVIPAMEIKDTGAYTFDQALGLMTAIRVDRDILTGGVLARRENREIRLLPK